MSREVRAVIFDMDGLMLDTERMAQRAWQEAGATRGYAFPDDIYLEAVGRTAQATGDVFRAAYGPEFPFDELYARKQHFYHQMLTEKPIPTMTGLFELLGAVDSLGLAKAVATSTVRELAEQKLASSGLRERFTHIVCGDEIANGKPAPDIFLAAAKLVDIAPAHCVVLEDSAAGVRAAHAAGMMPIMVPDLKQPSTEIRGLAQCVVESLLEVVPLLG